MIIGVYFHIYKYTYTNTYSHVNMNTFVCIKTATSVVVVSEKIEDDRDTSEDEATPPQDQFQFRSSILQLIASEKWSELLYFDELERELAAERLLPGFKSAVPTFPPTFKRVRNLGIENLISNDESTCISDS